MQSPFDSIYLKHVIGEYVCKVNYSHSYSRL